MIGITFFESSAIAPSGQRTMHSPQRVQRSRSITGPLKPPRARLPLPSRLPASTILGVPRSGSSYASATIPSSSGRSRGGGSRSGCNRAKHLGRQLFVLLRHVRPAGSRSANSSLEAPRSSALRSLIAPSSRTAAAANPHAERRSTAQQLRRVRPVMSKDRQPVAVMSNSPREFARLRSELTNRADAASCPCAVRGRRSVLEECFVGYQNQVGTVQ